MRLDKYLCDMGIASRSELKKSIKSGIVKVNKVTVKDPGFKVSESDIVVYNNEQIRYERYQYYMLNKPKGVLTATKDSKEKTVMDFFDKKARDDLFPVGRLDKDTTGLLIITNDGELAHRLLSPKKHVSKVYYATLDKDITEDDIQNFKDGIVIDEEFTALPARLVVDENNKMAGYVTVYEGKFHQVKRMFEATGNKVTSLKRLKMGEIMLDEGLKEGQIRRLNDEEVGYLMSVKQGKG